MFESKEKKKYASPDTEAIASLVENGIMQNSYPHGINGAAGTSAYDEEEDWN